MLARLATCWTGGEKKAFDRVPLGPPPVPGEADADAKLVELEQWCESATARLAERDAEAEEALASVRAEHEGAVKALRADHSHELEMLSKRLSAAASEAASRSAQSAAAEVAIVESLIEREEQ